MPDDAPLATAKHDAARAESQSLDDPARGSVTARAVTINRPVTEVFACFRDFANLPSFMENVVRVDDRGNGLSHWVVKAPGDRTVEWDARMTDEQQDRLIAWTSEPGADVPNSGRVEFADAGPRGTVVTATILYDPPGGAIGKFVAKMFGREPGIQARRDLRRLKQLMETGEVATAARNERMHEEQDA